MKMTKLVATEEFQNKNLNATLQATKDISNRDVIEIVKSHVNKQWPISNKDIVEIFALLDAKEKVSDEDTWFLSGIFTTCMSKTIKEAKNTLAGEYFHAALLSLLLNWFPASDFNVKNINRLVSPGSFLDNEEAPSLDIESQHFFLSLIFDQLKDGCKYNPELGLYVDTTFIHNFSRIRPAAIGGLLPCQDFALKNYTRFKKSPPEVQQRIIRTSQAYTQQLLELSSKCGGSSA